MSLSSSDFSKSRVSQTGFFGVFFLLIVGMMVFVTGCQHSSMGTVPSALVTSQGVHAENLLPESTWMVMKMGANDSSQLKALDELATFFPKEGTTQFFTQFISSFDKSLQNYGMTYEQDVKPIFSDRLNFLFAFSGSFGLKIPENSSSAPNGDASSQPQMEAVFPLQDIAKADAFLEKLTQKGEYQKSSHKGSSIYAQEEQRSFLVRVRDVLLITNTFEMAKQAIEKVDSASGTFLYLPSYQRALTKLPASLGFVYFDLKNLFGNLKMYQQEMLKNQNLTQQTQKGNDAISQLTSNSSLVDAMEGEIFALSAEQNGFRLHGSVFGNEEVLKQADVNFLTFQQQQPAYLYEKIPSENVLLYAETYNLKKQLDYYFKTEDFHKQVQEFFATQGLDVDKDVMPFLDKGVSFTLNDAGNLIPGFSFFVDGSSHPEGLQKVMTKFQDLLKGFVVPIKTTEIGSALVLEDVEVKGQKFHVLRLLLNKLPAEMAASIPAPFLGLKIELWYGVTADQLGFVAFQPDFDKDYGVKSFAHNTDFQQVKTLLNSEPHSGLFYVSPKGIMNFTSQIFGILKLVGGGLSAEQQKTYDLLKSYIVPLKAIMLGTGQVSVSEGQVDGFVLVGP